MWRDELGISDLDWVATPVAIRTILFSLHHQLRLSEIRCKGYQERIATLEQQVAQIDILKAEIAELKERLGQNSSNSSLPPSSDHPYQKKTNTKEPSGKKKGGQIGHEGKSRPLKPLKEVDHVVDLRPTICSSCGHLLLGDDPTPHRHQVSDIPPVKAETTEYRRHSLTCLACGNKNQAEYPVDVPSGSFGARTQATVAYMTGRLGASHRDVVEAMDVLYGLDVSLGSVSAIQQKVSDALTVPVDQARSFTKQQMVQYVDETHWYEQEQQKWLWVSSTKDVTAFYILDGRSKEQTKQVIEEDSRSVITTDRYKAYNWLPLSRRQICWSHIKRDFKAFVDRGGESAELGKVLLVQEKETFLLWHQFKAGAISRVKLQKQIEPVRDKIKELLNKASACEHSKTRNTCQNILKVEQALWTFILVEGVEPTNNLAERGLRRGVMWRRKSFGTESVRGSRFVERILTAISTLRQQGRNVLDTLVNMRISS
jgi:transposase